MTQHSDKPLHTTRPTALSLWREYRVFADRLELDSIPWGTLRIPFEDVRDVRVRPALVFLDLFRGDCGLSDAVRTLKLDLADLAEHVAIDKDGFWKQVRITPDDPARFQRDVKAALEAHRRSLGNTPAP